MKTASEIVEEKRDDVSDDVFCVTIKNINQVTEQTQENQHFDMRHSIGDDVLRFMIQIKAMTMVTMFPPTGRGLERHPPLGTER